MMASVSSCLAWKGRGAWRMACGRHLAVVVCTAVAASAGIGRHDARRPAGLPPGGPHRRSGAGGPGRVWRTAPFLSIALRGGAAEHGNHHGLFDSDLSLDHSGASNQDLSRLHSASESINPHGSAWPPADKDGADRFRRQVVKLMVQTMESFGFPESARKLELESGVVLHDGPALEALELHKSLLDGDWQIVDEILGTASWVDNQMRFMAYRQLYLELVHANRRQEAAQCLDANLQPAARALAGAQRKEVQNLKSLLSSPDTRMPATGSLSHEREKLADTIMSMVPGDVLLPSNRLEHLLRQSLRYQQTASLYPYTKTTELNLAEDLVFDESKLPHLCTEIKYHSDEVWVCKFSPSGKFLATAGRDGRIAIWSCAQLCAEEVVLATGEEPCSACDGIDQGKRACVCVVAHGSDDDNTEAAMCAQVGRTLVVSIEAQMAVCSLTWSSDESVVVAAGLQDNTARAWHVPSGMPAQALAPLQRMVSVVEWLAGHWLCAGGGGDEVIVLWSIDPVLDAVSGAPADPVARLATGGRTVISLSCSTDGKHLVALLSGQVLRFFDLERITQELALKRQEHHNTQLSCVNQAWFGAGGIENELSRPSNGLSVSDVQAVRGDGSLVLTPAKLPPALKYLASSPYSHVRAFECFLEITEPIAGLSYISSVVMPTPFPRDRIILNCVSVHSEPLVVELDTCSGLVLQNFRGHRMQRFVSGMAVGGPGEALVCAGSEDGCVMLWQRQTGKPVKVLIGHQGAVNCLSWCQLDGGAGLPYLLASASDDYSVRIWGPLMPSSPSFAQGARKQANAANGEATLNRLLANLAASSPDASPVAPSRKLGRTAGASDRPA